MGPIPGAENERFCKSCQRTVYRTDSVDTLRMLTKQGECVSFAFKPRHLDLQLQAPENTERTGCFVL
jgi:hypothetical protein